MKMTVSVPSSAPRMSRSLGGILIDSGLLKPEDAERVLLVQKEQNLRFGDAAVRLGLLTEEDIQYALSRQFAYAYLRRTPGDKKPVSDELVAAYQPFSQRVEQLRSIRSQLMLRWFDRADQRQLLTIVGSDRGEGRSHLAANLAVVFSQLGERTLLVDADMRNPRQHEVFKIDGNHGLSALLSGRDAGQVIHNVPDLPSLFVLPVGTTPPNPLELVERPAFGLLMSEMLAKFDHVVVDTSAAMLGADASVVAARCGAAIVVVRKDEARAAMLQDFVGLLGAGTVKIGGVVMNVY